MLTSRGSPSCWRGGRACLHTLLQLLHARGGGPEGHVGGGGGGLQVGEGELGGQQLPETQTEGEDIGLRETVPLPCLPHPTLTEYLVHWVNTSGAIHRRLPGCLVMFSSQRLVRKRDSPKSATTARPCSWMRMLWELRSLWMMGSGREWR